MNIDKVVHVDEYNYHTYYLVTNGNNYDELVDNSKIVLVKQNGEESVHSLDYLQDDVYLDVIDLILEELQVKTGKK